jgi:hypothetical protein
MSLDPSDAEGISEQESSQQAERCSDRRIASRAAQALTQFRKANVSKRPDRLIKIDLP